ncbi:MAG: FHA domain-containing protein, partial [Gemmataceae bacterium]
MSLGLLVLTAGKQEGKVLDIKQPQFLIGRDPQCHLRPASPLISKRHCALIQRDGKVFLRDFSSTNGTLLNDEPITGEVELSNKDRVKVGPIEFEVRIQASILRTPTPAPATRPIGTPTPAPPTKKPESAAPASPAIASAQPVKPPTKADTPLPATLANKTPPASTSSTGKPGGDEDIAAMLLSLDD